ncbi:MAG: MmgE/PrpD family protein [Saezia sp.]
MTNHKDTSTLIQGSCPAPVRPESETQVLSYSLACTNFTETLQFEDIPQRSIQQIKIYFLDWLGCLIRGYTTRQADPAKKYIQDLAGAPQASMVGLHQKASIIDAAFFNGYLGHILEMDDVDRESISHPATVVIPAALAVGEWRNKNGKELLTAITAGYEVMLRIGAAVTPAHYEIWHTTGTAGAFGSAMAAGKLFNLKKEELDWALGNAGTMAAGLWQFLKDGAMSKFLHAGRAASNGVFSAYMASNGFSGATRILEGSQGFFAGFAKQEINPKIFMDFSTNWRSGEVSIKPYPCCRHTHSAIDAANQIREQAYGKEVKSIKANTYSAAQLIAGIEDPKTPQEAKFSLKFCIARTLLHGLLTEQDFTQETLHDLPTRELMKRIELHVSPELDAMIPQNWPSHMSATLLSGETLYSEVNSPSGDPENPIDWEGIKRKFAMMTQSVLDTAAQEEISDLCNKLESIQHCDEIISLINQRINFKPKA